jgi:hypothetical protein
MLLRLPGPRNRKEMKITAARQLESPQIKNPKRA